MAPAGSGSAASVWESYLKGRAAQDLLRHKVRYAETVLRHVSGPTRFPHSLSS